MKCPACKSDNICEQSDPEQAPWACLDCDEQIEEPLMQWAFTFGSGYSLANNYVLVEAVNEIDARIQFVSAREKAGAIEGSGVRWSHQYLVDDKWDENVERFKLTEVPIDTPIDYLPRQTSEG